MIPNILILDIRECIYQSVYRTQTNFQNGVRNTI